MTPTGAPEPVNRAVTRAQAELMRRLLPFRDRGTVEHQVYDLPGRERCDRCDALLEGDSDFTYFRICPVCGRHFSISASRRIEFLVDPGSFQERDVDLYSTDPLDFHDDEAYRNRLYAQQERTGRSDGMTTGVAEISGHPVVLAILDFSFMGGSMGVVVGERLARAAELAAEKHRPLIAIVASGGARMQEGMLSLLQMARTTSAVAQLKTSGVPYISVLTDPTSGGVLASFASLADLIVAEPEALIGFAGPRVVEQTLGRELPPGSHSAEFQLAHGMVDAIVARPEQRAYLGHVLKALDRSQTAVGAPKPPADPRLHSVSNGWATVLAARAIERPSTRDYLRLLDPGYVELHGDRMGADDPAVVAALGRVGGMPVAFAGFDRFAESEIEGASGRPLPAGFRKAQRLLNLAERLGLPVVTFIDTPGAYPGIEAESAGVAGEIARTLEAMCKCRTPTIAVVVGEGGSGGALALAVADRILMQQKAFFSVISPEGAATILFRDADRAPELAESLKITADALRELGVVDEIVPEPEDDASSDPAEAAALIEQALHRHLLELRKKRLGRVLKARRSRYRQIGSDFIAKRRLQPEKSEDDEGGASLSA